MKVFGVASFVLVYFFGGGVAYVVYGVVVFVLIEGYFKGEYGEHFIDVAAYVPDAMLFPCPYLGGYVVVDGGDGVLLDEAGYFEVEAGVVYEYHCVGAGEGDVALAAVQVAQDGGQV